MKKSKADRIAELEAENQRLKKVVEILEERMRKPRPSMTPDVQLALAAHFAASCSDDVLRRKGRY